MKRITTSHGTGGPSSFDLIENIFKKCFREAGIRQVPSHDAAEFKTQTGELIITTDSHVIEPIIFPGGDIGKLAVSGVVNDLITRGGKPKYLSLGFILEEGLAFSTLQTILRSMASVMKECEIELLCADTKVVPVRNENPGMMISSTLLGEPIRAGIRLPGPKIEDQIIVTGPIGTHGLAILQAREKLPFRTTIHSDCAPLLSLLTPLFLNFDSIHYMRDPTRGGLSGVLHELSIQFGISFELTESPTGIGPTLPAVRAGLEILGLDPIDVANEGVMVIFAESSDTDSILQQLRLHPLGRHALSIGRVIEKQSHAVTLKTQIGGRRGVAWNEGLSLPRIC
jgi:hydrogenase expression/formation protein HypE